MPAGLAARPFVTLWPSINFNFEFRARIAGTNSIIQMFLWVFKVVVALGVRNRFTTRVDGLVEDGGGFLIYARKMSVLNVSAPEGM